MKKLLIILLFPLLAQSQFVNEAAFNYWKRVIEKTTGDRVSFLTKAKTLKKFGRNIDLDAGIEEQVWITGGLETLSTSNDITHFASNSPADTQTILR